MKLLIKHVLIASFRVFTSQNSDNPVQNSETLLKNAKFGDMPPPPRKQC